MYAWIKPRLGSVISSLRTIVLRLLPHLVSGMLLFSAALPSWYTVQHLWVDNMEVTQQFTDVWCRYELLCELRVPSYFLLVFSVFLVVPLVFLVYRAVRARLPLLEAAEPTTGQLPPAAEPRQTAIATITVLAAMG